MSDFWQMVWDHNSQTVVVLSDTTDDDYQVFWPLKQADVEFENFRVRFIDEHKIQLPAVGNHPSHPEEYVTQSEVAAQSLQVLKYFIFHQTLSNVSISFVINHRMITNCGYASFTALAGRIVVPPTRTWLPCSGCLNW